MYPENPTDIDETGYRAEADLNRDGTIDSTDNSLVSGQSDVAAISAGLISEPGGTTDNQIGYDGYCFNAETMQYAVRFRVYDPGLGRWLQRDPLDYEDSMSLYLYTMSSPVGLSDPTGLSCRTICRSVCFGLNPGNGVFARAKRYACYLGCEAGCATDTTIRATGTAWNAFKNYVCNSVNTSMNNDYVACACLLADITDFIPNQYTDAIDCACNLATTIQIGCASGLDGFALYGAISALDCASFLAGTAAAAGTGGPGILLDGYIDATTLVVEEALTWVYLGQPSLVSGCSACARIILSMFPPPPPPGPVPPQYVPGP